MHKHDIALVIAGVIGSGSAVVHGVLTQRHIMKRLQGLVAARIGTAASCSSAPSTGSSGGSPCLPRPTSLNGRRGLQRVCWWGARISTLLSPESGQPGADHTQAGYSTEQR